MYTSNRGLEEDSIVVFSINKSNGKLKLIEHINIKGNHSRDFAISPDGKFLMVANHFSNNITIFKRDLKSGKLIGLRTEITVNSSSYIQIKSYNN